MELRKTDIPGVLLLSPKVYGDERGFFLEAYNERTMAGIGLDCRFVQDNHSKSVRSVLRGLHYQIGKPQAKLVRVIVGEVFDVAVDIRRGSPTFGQWFGCVLSAENKQQLFVPEGFAHGFLVLSDSAEFLYKCSDFYAPECERGIAWNDPQIAIEWPLAEKDQPLLSEKDAKSPLLADVCQHDLPRFKEAVS